MSVLSDLAAKLRSFPSLAAQYLDTRLSALESGAGVTTAAAVGLTSATTNGAGSGSALAKATHTHAITALNGASAGTAAEKSAGALANADFALPLLLILDVPQGATGDIDFTGAPFKFRVIDVYARKVTTSADAGDSGALQTSAGAAISSTLALNITAGTFARTVSIDPANHEIAAAGTLRWRRTQSTNAACKVHVTVVRVA